MRKEKQLLLDSIVELLQSHSSFVFFDYGSLTAMESVKLRKALASAGVVEVVPKRIFQKALSGSEVTVQLDMLKGNVAVALAFEELPVLLKTLEDFQKTCPKIDVLGGFFEGVLYGSAETKSLAGLPTKAQMRSILLGTFMAAPTSLVRVLNAPACSLLYCMNNKIDSQK